MSLRANIVCVVISLIYVVCNYNNEIATKIKDLLAMTRKEDILRNVNTNFKIPQTLL